MTQKIGILGFAHAHVGSYCRRWLDDPGLGVVPAAGWDHDADRLRKAVADCGCAACETVDELLARNDIVVWCSR